MASPSDNLRCLMGRPAAMLILIMLVWISSSIDIRAADTCLSASGEKAVAACRRELLQDPGNLDIRFALSDAFMSLSRYEDAVAVLRQGFEHAPGDDRIKKKLMLAESYLEEQRWIEKQQRRNEDTARDKKQSAQIRLSLIRCKKLTGDAAMAACNDGLEMVPDQPELLTARGLVWMEMDRVGNAILDFESALAVDPRNREAAKNLRLAQTRRTVKLAQCFQNDGVDGLDACEAALIPGASDEGEIRRRQAGLLQAMGQPAASTDSEQSGRSGDAEVERGTPAPAASGSGKAPSSAPQKLQPAPESIPSSETAVVTKPPAPVEKPPVRAVASAPTPVAVSPPPPEAPPPAVASAPAAPTPEPTQVLPTAIQAPASREVAQVRPRRFSNAPEVPGITH